MCKKVITKKKLQNIIIIKYNIHIVGIVLWYTDKKRTTQIGIRSLKTRHDKV